MNYNRKQLFQERLAKEDIRLLIDVLKDWDKTDVVSSRTRIELLIGKLKRMEKQ